MIFNKLAFSNSICLITLLIIKISAEFYEDEIDKNATGIEKLMHHIFTRGRYNDLVRPIDSNGLTNIFTELKLLQIDLDEKYQELISTVWLEMSWNDTRFIWDPVLYDNVEEITIPVHKIWFPDVVLQNGVGQNDYLTEFKYFNPWISHTGSVTWVPEVRLHTKCSIKVKDFPFDKQCCEISFYSWAHTAKQMTIKQMGGKKVTNTTHLSDNTEWKIYHTCAFNRTIRTGADLDWWVTSYVIFIKRNSLYHVYTLLMPCIVLSLLSMLLFLLPPDSGEKISLGVTILLAFFVNLLVVANYTPESSAELPVIGVYYTFNIAQVSVSVSASILVLKMHFRGHKPELLPKLFHKVLCLQHSLEQLNQMNQLNNASFNKYSSYNSLDKNFLFLREEDSKSNDFYFPNGKVQNNNSMSFSARRDSFELATNRNIKSRRLIVTETKPASTQEEGTESKLVKEIVKTLRSIKHTNKMAKKEKDLLNTKEGNLIEWKEAARRLDLIFFVMSAITVCSTPILLFGKYAFDDLVYSDSDFCKCNPT